MESTQQPTLKGLGEFLVKHEACGAGFDTSHPGGLGAGRVSTRCRGCGATFEYATATIEFEREVEPASSPTQAGLLESPVAAEDKITDEIELPKLPPAGIPPVPPVAARPAPADAAPPPRNSGPAKKGNERNRAIAFGLLAFAAAALIFAVIRLSGDRNASVTQSPLPPEQEAPATLPSEVPAAKPKAQPSPEKAKQKGQNEGTEGKAKAKEKGQGGEPSTKPEAGEKVVETNRFSMIVPNTWEQRESAGGFTMAPPGDAPVSVQVYFENDPGMDIKNMTAQTEAFLVSRDPDTRVKAPRRLQVSGNPAFELRANGPAGSQAALGVLAGPYRYLVIESVDPGALDSSRSKAERALATFQPK